MDFKTIGGKSAIILSAFLFLLFNSCKKEIEQETVITIRCETPHNGQGIAGCKVTIYEIKSKKDFAVTGDVKGDVTNTYSGITDENGNATIRFHYMRKSKYQYKLAYDYSGIQKPEGMNEVEIVTPQGWATYLNKNQFGYTFKFNILGKCGIHVKFENVNCYNATDEMQFEGYNISKFESEDGIYSPDHYVGCGVVFESTSPSNTGFSTGLYVIKSKIFRNNMTHIQYDTFNLQPGVLNEMIIEY